MKIINQPPWSHFDTGGEHEDSRQPTRRNFCATIWLAKLSIALKKSKVESSCCWFPNHLWWLSKQQVLRHCSTVLTPNYQAHSQAFLKVESIARALPVYTDQACKPFQDQLVSGDLFWLGIALGIYMRNFVQKSKHWLIRLKIYKMRCLNFIMHSRISLYSYVWKFATEGEWVFVRVSTEAFRISDSRGSLHSYFSSHQRRCLLHY